MKKYELHLKQSVNENRLIITLPRNIKDLKQPINLYRDKVPEDEPDTRFTKKRSEAVEVEEEAYTQLKEREKAPLVIKDSINTEYTSNLIDTDITDKKNNYFALVNMGSSFRIVPINSWYRFSKRQTEVQTIEEAEAKQKAKRKEIKSGVIVKEEDKEIDYEEEFDDDSGDEVFVIEEGEKILSDAGKELADLVENYEKEKSSESEVKEEEQVKKQKVSSEESDEYLRKFFVRKSMTAKEFYLEVKKLYKVIDGNMREKIKRFLKSYCELDDGKLSKGGEKCFRIKKSGK